MKQIFLENALVFVGGAHHILISASSLLVTAAARSKLKGLEDEIVVSKFERSVGDLERRYGGKQKLYTVKEKFTEL